MKKSIFYAHIKAAAEQSHITIPEMLSEASSLGYVGVDVEWRGYDELYSIYQSLPESIKIASIYRILDPTNLPDEQELHKFFACITGYGCHRVMIVPWKYREGYDRDAEFQAVCTYLQKICILAKQHDVVISVEDFDNNNVIISDTASIRRAFERIPELCHTLDTGNYIYFGESVADAWKMFSDRIVHVHLKDRLLAPLNEGEKALMTTDGIEIYPTPVGQGILPMEDCLRHLHKIGYKGYLSAEHFGSVRMRDYIRQSAQYIDGVLDKLKETP